MFPPVRLALTNLCAAFGPRQPVTFARLSVKKVALRKNCSISVFRRAGRSAAFSSSPMRSCQIGIRTTRGFSIGPLAPSWTSVLSQTFESSDGNTAQKIAKRARIVLMSADGRGQRNQTPKPFTWTAKAKPILASHRRTKKAMAIVKAGCK